MTSQNLERKMSKATYLVGTRDGNESIRAKILHPSRIDRHQVDNIARRTTAFITRKDQCLFVNGCDKAGTDTHASFETDLEILDENVIQSLNWIQRNVVTWCMMMV